MREQVLKLFEWARGRTGRTVLTALLLAPPLVYIGYLTWQNWGKLRQYQWELHVGPWALSFLGYSAALACLLLAWHSLIGRLGGKARFMTNARVYCLSNLPKRLPSFVWYMLGRTLLYQEAGVTASVSLTGSALELAMTATSGLLAYFLTLPLAGGILQEGWRLAVAGGLFLACVIVLQPAIFNRIVGFFLRRMGSQERVTVAYRDILALTPLYLLAWVAGGAMLYAVVGSVYPLPLQALPTAIGIWAASGTLTLMLSSFLLGFGLREVTLSIFLTALVPQHLAVIVALLFGLTFLVAEMAWTGIFALLGRSR